MRIAIMQPYAFPYLGYFQLISAVEKFIFLDDVSYIKKGWINRNRILLNGREHLFTIPLRDASQNKHISDTLISYDHKWQEKLLQTLYAAYHKCPYYDSVYSMIESLINQQYVDINSLAQESTKAINDYLNLQTVLSNSSDSYPDSALKGQERIIDICLKAGATTYINLWGGRELYRQDDFRHNGIVLAFLEPHFINYPQPAQTFIPGLSIIDILMNNSPVAAATLLKNYTLHYE